MNPSWWLHPRSSQDVRTTGDSIGPANDGILTAAVVLTPQLSPSSRDSPAVTTEDSRPLLTKTRPVPLAPTSSQGARTRNISGSASPSEYTPVHQQFGDRVPQGILAPGTRTYMDPPGSSALLTKPPSNSRILVSTVHSDLPPSPSMPQGDSPLHHNPPPLPSDTLPPLSDTTEPPGNFPFF